MLKLLTKNVSIIVKKSQFESFLIIQFVLSPAEILELTQ